MEFSQIFGFLKILSESIKVFLQNAKSIALITILSLLPSSILFLLFSYLYQSTMTYMTNSIMDSDSDPSIILRIITYFALLISVELTFLFAYFAITHASGIATILASLASYSHTKLSLQDLYSSFKAKWKSCPIKIRNNLRGSRKSMQFLWIFVVALAVPLVMFHPNPVTITVVSVVGVSVFVFQLYDAVVLALASVIPVVEDGCEAAEALEKAEKLVQGQRLHGFMVNLFFNLLWLIIGFGFWTIVGDKGGFNLMVYGLLFVNSISLWRIFASVVYTVYYFQCMEYHGQKPQLLGNFRYTAVPVSNDIP